jgi:hypothetical protein
VPIRALQNAFDWHELEGICLREDREMNVDYENKDSRYYRFPRQCPGYRPVPDSPGWVWWLTGATLGAVLLALVVLS